MPHVALKDSRPVHPAGARPSRTVLDPATRIRVTAVVRSRRPAQEREEAVERVARLLPRQRRHLSAAELGARFGSRREDLDAVAAWGRQQGLEAEEMAPERRCVRLAGLVEDLGRAFKVDLALHEHAGGIYLSHTDEVHLPPHLHGVVEGVLGLEDRPVVEHHLFTGGKKGKFASIPAVRAAYGFPPDADGSGQRVGVVSMGGGVYLDDLHASLGPGRQVEILELDGQTNQPTDPEMFKELWTLTEALYGWESVPATGEPVDYDAADITRFKWTIETTADLEILGQFAPGAGLLLCLTPNTMQGKYTAFTTLLASEDCPAVLSCSWGAREDGLTLGHVRIMDDLLATAALRGVTLCFSSGDDGDGSRPMADGQDERPVTPHFPATSPHVLSCGGTMRPAAASVTEVVWKEDLGQVHMSSGGGVSNIFAPPWWQAEELVQEKAGRFGRGQPDVAGKADMTHGYGIRVAGLDIPIGGTSSAAPMWAALVCCLNQRLGTAVGFLTPLLYLYRDQFEGGTRSVISGSNGIYAASPGWDACTGWGTPRGVGMLQALRGPAPD